MANPGSGQLDRQGQAIELRAELPDGGGVHIGKQESVSYCPGSLHEELDRGGTTNMARRDDAGHLGHREWIEGKVVFGPQVQWLAARRKDRELRTGRQQVSNARGGIQHLFEIVHDEEKV